MANRLSAQFTTRLYQDENDLLQIQDLLMEARRQTDDWRYPHIGDLLFWFFMVACHLDPQEHIRLWHASGRLVGYAILGEDPSVDFYVLPKFTWQGIEAQALTWVEAFRAELRQADPGRWGGHLVSGARKDDLKRIEFLESHGFKPGGPFSEVNMLRSLDEPVPKPAITAGFQIRDMAGISPQERRTAISRRAGAQREVWQPWTVGDVRDEDYAFFMNLPGYHGELDVVAVAPNGEIAAYVNGWIDPTNRIGDFGPVGACPAYRRQGLTRAVLLECMQRMKAQGMDRVSVSTGVSNTAAIRLYESVGFKIVNQFLEYIKNEQDGPR